MHLLHTYSNTSELLSEQPLDSAAPGGGLALDFLECGSGPLGEVALASLGLDVELNRSPDSVGQAQPVEAGHQHELGMQLVRQSDTECLDLAGISHASHLLPRCGAVVMSLGEGDS